MTERRLGRKAIKTDSRTLRLACYMTPALAPPPPEKDWSAAVTQPWGMLMNDTLGDCTIAGVGHAVQTLTANAGAEALVADADVLHFYEIWDGYDPSNPATDAGGIELDVLNAWQKSFFSTATTEGSVLVAHKLDAFANANPVNVEEVKQAIFLFGGIYIGMNVPNFIMAAEPPGIWDVVANDGGLDGGHCVFVTGYDAELLTFVSWGTVYKMTWAYWSKYVDEAHALLSPDFLAANGMDPCGFDMAQLQSDLAAIV